MPMISNEPSELEILFAPEGKYRGESSFKKENYVYYKTDTELIDETYITMCKKETPINTTLLTFKGYK